MKFPLKFTTRVEKTRVKTARGRKTSSTKWLNRHLNDEYVQAAKKLGYRSRASFKLIQLHEKFNLFQPNMKIVDLGAAPGGWSQIALHLAKNSNVVAVDLLQMEDIDGVDFFQGDFLELKTQELIIDKLQGKADIIISDMAPSTTGHKSTDHLKIVDLCDSCIEFASKVLKKDGVLVFKTFQGGALSDTLIQLQKHFTKYKHYKPKASRKDSSEMYLVAQGFKGRDN